jgi:hypothetical protein
VTWNVVPGKRAAVLGVGLIVANVAIILMIGRATGRLDVNGGRGWDGAAFVDMLREGVLTQSSNERLRPLVVLMNRPIYWLSDRSVAGAIDAFAAMNVVYMAWLTAAIVMLASAYGASDAARLFLTINVALCIATSKYFVYYPTLVDLGAYAVIMTAMYAAVRRQPVAAPILAVAAALAREFGLGVAIFGFIRELRIERSLKRATLMYAPAVAAAVAWRIELSRLPGYGVLTLRNLDQNSMDLQSADFMVFYLYFCVTVFGGISMLLVARAAACIRFFRREPEWFVFAAPIVVIGTREDMWRYLAYALPCAVALVASCERHWTTARRIRLFTIATIGTVVTQRPFEAITTTTYFTHWFPIMVVPSAPPDDLERLWRYWGLMMLATGIFVWLMSAFDSDSAGSLEESRDTPATAVDSVVL